MYQPLACLVVASALMVVPERPARSDAEKADAVARELAETLCKAVLARDLDGVMKVVDVPWCADTREIIEDRDVVREEFRRSFARGRDFSRARVHIRKVATLAAFRKDGKPPPTRKVSLGEVLGKDDRVVFL